MARIFIYDGREFPDPNPTWTPEQVRQNMASFFGELSNAETDETKRGEDTVYTFTARLGKKGEFDPHKIADQMCRCGHKKSEHIGLDGHGPCSVRSCACGKFIWSYFLDKDGNKYEPRRS